MPRYFTMVLRLEDDANCATELMRNVELFKGVTLAAAGWSHAFDERDAIKAEAIRRGSEMVFPGGVDPLTLN